MGRTKTFLCAVFAFVVLFLCSRFVWVVRDRILHNIATQNNVKWTSDNLNWWTANDSSDSAFFNMTSCSRSLGKTFDEDLQIVMSYPVTIHRKYIRELGLDIKESQHIPKVPVLVFGCDYKYFTLSKRMLESAQRNVLRLFPEMKIIFYDLGLSAEQEQMIRKLCNCEYRRFPFETFPPYVKHLQEYRFKPLIIQYVLKEHPFVMWADTSLIFLNRTMREYTTDLFDYARKRGMLYTVSSWPMTYFTDKRMFKFLGEPPCIFRGIRQKCAAFLFFTRTKLVNMVMERWVSCALHPYCMAPPRKPQCKSKYILDVVGACHRWEQAFLTFMTTRLYHREGYPAIPKRFYNISKYLSTL